MIALNLLSPRMIPVTVPVSKLQYSPLFLPIRTIKGNLVPLPSGNIPDTPIEWKKPEKSREWDPHRTGDSVRYLEVDMKKQPIMIEKSTELATANDLVQKLFTFDFLGRKHAMTRAKDEMIESVRNHEYDTSSTEVQIAIHTANIRNLLQHLDSSNRRELKARMYVCTILQKRKKRLNLLRKWDYKRFEWLLEKLDLYFQPTPEYYFRTRQKSIRSLTNEYCDNLRARKLSELRQKFEDEKESFLRHKVESLEWMRKEEIECGVNPTVSEEEIEAAKKQLNDHLEFLATKEVVIDKSRNIMDSVADQ